MQIESIKLKNFKSFKDVTMLDIPHYCVIVSANGTGKSTLFDVFGFLKDCLTYNVRQALQVRGGYAEVVSRGDTGGAPIELESWYLGDLNAVEQGLQIAGLARKQEQSRYRTPDGIANPGQELRRLTGDKYQKIGGSRAVGLHLSPDGNRSHSFNVFVSGLRGLVQSSAGG